MNELKHKQEFEKVLADYQLSSDAKQSLSNIKLALFVGPSSSGRNTIINELLKSEKYHFIVSDTTRQPRANNGVMEQNGREYWFRTEDEVLADLHAGEFLEAAIIHGQQVSGISMRELEVAEAESKIAVNEIEIVGAANIYAAKPDAMFVFVIPPSYDEWIARMSARGALPADEVSRRLSSAVTEITTALSQDYYWFVVNDTFRQTAKKVEKLIELGSLSQKEQAQARRVAEQLLKDTKQHIAVDN
jgi:guanylate kinase